MKILYLILIFLQIFTNINNFVVYIKSNKFRKH